MARSWLSGFVKKGRAEPPLLHPGEWPESTGKPRVLIENPDRADLWAHAEILRDAGYDVALCHGPSQPDERAPFLRRRLRHIADVEPPPHEARTLCPLVVQGRCSLVEGADVVVSTTALPESREVIAALSSSATALVVEGPQARLELDSDVTGDATTIGFPVTEKRLLAAVEDARGSRTGS